MKEDEEGFLYPNIDKESCIDCGLCEKVCPFQDKSNSIKHINCYASNNPDDNIRKESSSGGIFTLLSEHVISKGGVVFGARFDSNWGVIHDYTEDIEGLAAFRGSKYVQSEIRDTYRQAEAFLKKGRLVLFSGTLCQIKALRCFLQKDYDNLTSVAIACHSVPSPKVWKDYLKGLNLPIISHINFRDKKISWEQYGLSITYANKKKFFQMHDNNEYMQLFLHGFIARPSCFNCPAKNNNSHADIILGDCWGITKVLPSFKNDHTGINLIVIQTMKGEQIFKTLISDMESIPYNEVIKYNHGLTYIASQPKNRSLLWKSYLARKDKRKLMNRFAKPYIPSLNHKIKFYIYNYFKKDLL